MSKREELRRRRQAQARRRQMIPIGVVAFVAIAFTGFLIYQNTRPIGEIIPIEKETLPFAQGKSIGPEGASVTIQVFSDFQCPFCGVFAREGVERQLIEQYAASGQARLEYRHYIVVDWNVGGSESRRAAEASECANEQGEFWNYHNLLFTNQNGEGLGAFNDRRLKAFAETLELDTAQFNACFDSGRYASAVRADEQLAGSLGVRGTPTVFVNGVRVENPLNFAEFQGLIEAALSR
jgi:protein-disulfide isomerase